MKTFYIASSSLPAQRDRVIALSAKLQHLFGWKWHNNWDWTMGFDLIEDRRDLEELKLCAQNDLVGARDCDVFIFLQVDVASLGANREYGVRWGQERMIYRVSTIEEHLFDMLPFVKSFKNEDELVNFFISATKKVSDE